MSDSAAALAATEPPAGTRKRLDHVDAMRPIKQSAVISTHALIFFSPLSTSLLAAALLTLTHFSRDAFLFVSACMLAYSYRETSTITLRHYSKRRFMGVVLPYLVWTVIYFPIAQMTQAPRFPYFSLDWSALFTGHGAMLFLHALYTGYYHLYFLVVLIEFYVLFPLVFLFIRRFRGSHPWIVAGSLVWQLVFPWAIRHGWFGFRVSPAQLTRLVVAYPLYLLGGVVAAFYLEQFHDWVWRWRWWLAAGTCLTGAVPIIFEYVQRHGGDLPAWLAPGSDPFAAAVVPFNCGAIIMVYLLGFYLVSPKRSALTRAITASGAEAAYGIYLAQMVWIIFGHRWLQAWGVLARVPWVPMMIIAVTVVYMLGWLFSAVFARTPFARGLVGRSQVPWSTLIPHPSRHLAPHPDIDEGPLNLATE